MCIKSPSLVQFERLCPSLKLWPAPGPKVLDLLQGVLITDLVMIFSRGSGGRPTASCFCRTKMSVAAFAKSSTFFFNMPESFKDKITVSIFLSYKTAENCLSSSWNLSAETFLTASADLRNSPTPNNSNFFVLTNNFPVLLHGKWGPFEWILCHLCSQEDRLNCECDFFLGGGKRLLRCSAVHRCDLPAVCLTSHHCLSCPAFSYSSIKRSRTVVPLRPSIHVSKSGPLNWEKKQNYCFAFWFGYNAICMILVSLWQWKIVYTSLQKLSSALIFFAHSRRKHCNHSSVTARACSTSYSGTPTTSPLLPPPTQPSILMFPSVRSSARRPHSKCFVCIFERQNGVNAECVVTRRGHLVTREKCTNLFIFGPTNWPADKMKARRGVGEK